jgi:hypothetical protein
MGVLCLKRKNRHDNILWTEGSLLDEEDELAAGREEKLLDGSLIFFNMTTFLRTGGFLLDAEDEVATGQGEKLLDDEV